MKREWPYNLLAAVFKWGNKIVEFDEPEDLEMSVEYVLNSLNPLYKHYVISHFKEGKTYGKICSDRKNAEQIIRYSISHIKHNKSNVMILSKGLHSYIISLEERNEYLNHELIGLSRKIERVREKLKNRPI